MLTSNTSHTVCSTATLVEGPSDAHVVEALSGTIGTLYDDCSIKDGTAVCTAIISATDTIVTLAVTTETVQPFEVQVAEVCQLSVIQLLRWTDTHGLVDISVGVGSWERRADWPCCDCAGC